MNHLLAGVALLLSSTAASALCFVPNAPYEGADNWQIQNYYRDLENYQNCMQREMQQQQYDREQQERRNRNNNGSFLKF